MLVLRYAALLALVVWIGGLVALGGIAAPSIFDVVAQRQIADGRVLSGALFGEMLARFTIVAYISGAVFLLSLIVRRVLGPRPHRFGWRAGIVAVMLAVTVYAAFSVTARIAQLQRDMGVAASSLPEADPRRREFGRLHGLSTALQLVPLLGGLMLIYWEIKE